MSQQTSTHPPETSAPSRRAVVFACRYCARIGADRAGKERLAMPPFFRLIDVDCAAEVEPDLVLRAFADGIHGVAVLGCHLGGCRHNEANRAAHARLSLLADLLDTIGLDRRRLLLSWGTAHEAGQFAGLMESFARTLETLPDVSAKPARLSGKEAAPC